MFSPFTRLFSLVLIGLLAACSDGDPSLSPGSQAEMRAALDKLDGPDVTGVDKTMLQNAETAEAEGNFARAAGYYQQMHDRTPEKREWEMALANAQRRADTCNDALAHYEALAKKDPKDVDALEGKALCLMNIGESKEASVAFTEVLAQDPNRWRSLNAVGVLFAGKNKIPEAIAYFEKAAQVDSGQIAVTNNLGLAYLLDKRYDQAIDTFLRAQKRLPSKSKDKPRVDMNLALAYALSGDMENAQKYASPHVSEAGLYNNLGFFAKLAKDERLARDYLNMALSKSPTYYRRAWENLDRVRQDTRGELVETHGVKVESGNTAEPHAVKAPKPAPEKLNTSRKNNSSDAAPAALPPKKIEKPDAPAIETDNNQ